MYPALHQAVTVKLTNWKLLLLRQRRRMAQTRLSVKGSGVARLFPRLERVGWALADALQRLSFIVSALVAVFTAILPLYIASETRKGLKSDYIIVVVACLISLFILKLMTGWIVP